MSWSATECEAQKQYNWIGRIVLIKKNYFDLQFLLCPGRWPGQEMREE